MAGVAAEQELYRACRIIFGPDLTVSREFLEYIQSSGVKSAFRKKAMETHPDRLTAQWFRLRVSVSELYCKAFDVFRCVVAPDRQSR